MAGKAKKKQQKLARQEARAVARQASQPVAPSRMQPPNQPRGNTSVLFEKQSLFIGPLPSPETVEEYAALIPDAPERLFGMWERQAAHRQKIENRSSIIEAIMRIIGQFGALGIVGGAGWLAYTLAMAGKDMGGVVALAGGIATIVGLIVFRNKA